MLRLYLCSYSVYDCLYIWFCFLFVFFTVESAVVFTFSGFFLMFLTQKHKTLLENLVVGLNTTPTISNVAAIKAETSTTLKTLLVASLPGKNVLHQVNMSALDWFKLLYLFSFYSLLLTIILQFQNHLNCNCTSMILSTRCFSRSLQ